MENRQAEPEGPALFYRRAEPLNSELHGALGLVPSSTPFGFAAKTNAVPLNVMEFPAASGSYPIIFTADERRLPLVVVGDEQDRNLFVQPDGAYLAGAYIPAYIRRFPFLALQDTGGRTVVCLERETPIVSPDGSVRLFENGEATDYTKGCIEFCRSYEQDVQRTLAFVEYLKQHDLFAEREIAQTVRGTNGETAQLPLSTVVTISEDKFNALPDEVIVEMRRNGALTHIYAQLHSQGNWDRILALSSNRRAAARDAAAA